MPDDKERSIHRWFVWVFVVALGCGSAGESAVPEVEPGPTPIAAAEGGGCDRLVSRLDEVARQWARLGDARVPASGHSLQTIFMRADPDRVAETRQRWTRWARLPLAARQLESRTWLARADVEELDLWLPAWIAESLRAAAADEAISIVDLWVEQLVEVARRDILLSAASDAFDLCSGVLGADTVAPLVKRWGALPEARRPSLGAAHLAKSRAQILAATGDTEGSLAAYRQVAGVFGALGDSLGRANALRGQAATLRLLERHEDALRVNQEALDLYLVVADERGLGNCRLGEGESLLALGRPEQAVVAFRRAAAHYELLGDPAAYLDARRMEGAAHTMTGDHAAALDAFRDVLGRAAGQLSSQELADLKWLEANALRHLGRRDETEVSNLEALPLDEGQRDQAVAQGEQMLVDAVDSMVTGRFDQAYDTYRRIELIGRAIDDARLVGMALRGQGDALQILGAFERALDAYDRALPSLREAGAAKLVALTLRSRGDVFQSTGRLDESLEAYRAARSHFSAVDDLRWQGLTWNNESDVMLRLGRNSEARTALEMAKGLFERAEDWINLAKALQSEGRILQRQGAYDEAARLVLRAREQLARGAEKALRSGAESGWAATYLLASLWQDEGRIAFALDRYREALDAHRVARRVFDDLGDRVAVASTWDGEGDALLALGRLDEAEAAYRRARDLYIAGGSIVGEANTVLGIARTRLRSGRHRDALDAFIEAFSLYQSRHDLIGMGSSVLGQAIVAIEQAQLSMRPEQLRRAAALAADAARYFEHVEGVDMRLQALAVESIATAEDDPGRATDRVDEALSLHEQWRNRMSTESSRIHTDVSAAPLFALAIVLTEQRRGDDWQWTLVELSELAKSRALLDSMAHGTPARSLPAVDSETVGRMTPEQRRLGRGRQAELETRAGKGSRDRQRQDLAEARELEQTLEWDAYLQIVARRAEGWRSFEPLDRRDLRTLTKDVGPILAFHTTPVDTFGMLLLPGDPHPRVRRLGVDTSELEAWNEDLRRHFANKGLEEGAETASRRLWDRLLAPFVETIVSQDVSAVTLVPQGPLHDTPFEALIDPAGRPLFERWDVSISPSLTALHVARQRHRRASVDDRFASFAPGERSNRAVREAQRIGRLFPNGFRVEATFDSYAAEIGEARQIFVSTTGVAPDPSAMSSGEAFLEIRNDLDHDSRLRASEIAAIGLQAELVTLSACDGAAGRLLASDDRLDLARAFLVAGAASVLASRWKVPVTEEASQFMVDFYRAYREGGPDGEAARKDAALTEARRLARRRGVPPAVWAAWALIGDPR